MRRVALVRSVLLVPLLLLTACGGGADAWVQKDLVLVSVDTLRAERLPFYGGERDTGGDPDRPWTPSWLAARGTVYDACWASAGQTLPSLGNFWTGKPQLEHGAISNFHSVQGPTRMDALREAGWTGHALVANRTLHVRCGLAGGFASWGVLAKEREPEIPRTLLTRTEPTVRAGQPMVVWAHFMAPHQPYTPPVEYARRYLDRPEPWGSNELLEALHRDPSLATPEMVEHLKALYDAEIRHASDMVAEFLEGLDRQYRDAGRGGLLDNARIVFFSDHGEDLADHHGYFMHAKSLYAGTVRVPLVVVGEGFEAGARIAAPLALGDVLPMVLEGRRPDPGLFFATWRDRYWAVRDARFTLVHNPSGDRRGPIEPPLDVPFPYPEVALYDRDADPHEQHDVAAEHPERTRELLDQLRSWYFGLDRAVIEGGTLTPRERARLQELGYADVASEGAEPWSGSEWVP